MPRPHGFNSIRLALLLCAIVIGGLQAGALSTDVTAAEAPRPAAPALHNPYDGQLAAIEAALTHATVPETAVLLGRAYRLREYVDDPASVGRILQRVADDPKQDRLVRDEALRYLALVAAHENHLPDAEAKLQALGFVRDWAVLGPFTTPPADAPVALKTGQIFADVSGKTSAWRRLPAAGPQMWIDLANLFPHAGSSVAYAATALYSERPQRVALRFTADAAVTVTVNARQAAAAPDEAGIGFDQHAAAVELQAGWNSVLLKLAHNGDGPWRFGLRITSSEGGGIVLAIDPQRNVEVVPAVPVQSAQTPADLVALARAIADADPNSAAALEVLGRIEREHARGAGFDHLDAAARRSPTADRWLAVAEGCGDTACTFTALTAALRAEPDSEPTRVALANYYIGRSQLEKARDLLREALRLQPNDFVARNGLAELFVAVGQNTEALQQAQQLGKEFPGPLWLKHKLAARYIDLGLLDRADALLTSALRQDFDYSQDRELLLRVLERRRDGAALKAAYEQKRQLNPADPATLAELAALDLGAGRTTEAEAHMKAALAIAPDDDDLHVRFANLLARAGNGMAARQELTRAVAINPNQQQARRRLELTATSDEPADSDATYMADAALLAADARRNPPQADSNVVALADIRVERVYDNGLSAVRSQQVFYIATQQGVRDFSTRAVQYSPASQELRVLHARVYKRDGRILQGEETSEGGVADANVAMYYDVRSRNVRFPALEPGDVLELDYRVTPTTNTNPYGDYYGGLVVFRTNFALQLQRWVLITPAQRKFNILEKNMVRASVKESGGERIYRWETRDMLPLPSEPRGPALTDVAPYVHVSTFQSWDDVGRWYSLMIRPQFALDSTLREQAVRLVKNARTEQEKISAIHQFVLHNTHYVAMEFGIYSYKPYPVTQTYARRFGDCKDKAALMIALLRQAGIDADIALVRTRRLGEVAPQATSIALFNHAIVYIPKYDLWLDGTAEYAGSHELPLDDQGATALTVSAEGSATLRHIPITQPGDNYTRRTVRAQVAGDGHIEFTGVAYTRGEDAPGLRRDYETPERQRDAVRNALAEIFPSVKVEDVHVDGANDLEHPITVEFRGGLDTFAGRSLVPLASSWMPRAYVQQLASLASRDQDLILPAPWSTEEELHFELPAGATVTSMPADKTLNTAFGTASLQYRRNGREVVIHTSVQFRRLRITTGEYDQFREFCLQLERAFRNEIKVGLRG